MHQFKIVLMGCVVLLISILGCQAQRPALPENQVESNNSMQHSQAVSIEQQITHLIALARANSDLNAFITLDETGAIGRARELDQLVAENLPQGRLHGVPLIVKDNIHVAGLPNTAGTPGLQQFTPQQDSPVVAALKQEGAIILGKANMHELAFGITSNNHAYGAVANPHNRKMFAGGSSGGTASAIAASLVPAGLGTDTGGSVRIPASLTGITALRPSMGRYSQVGVTPVSSTRDTVGPMAGSVEQVALLDAIITAQPNLLPDVDLKGLRFGVPRTMFYRELDMETQNLTEQLLRDLKQQGAELVESDIPSMETLLNQSAFPIALYEVARDLREYLVDYNVGMTLEQLAEQTASPDVKGVFEQILGDGAINESDYKKALSVRESLQQIYADYLKDHRLDAIIFPTTPLPARPIENSLQTVELNGKQVPTFQTYIRNTDLASVVGVPAVSLPVGKTADGLPVGIELDGPLNSDRKLLAIALQLEKLIGKVF